MSKLIMINGVYVRVHTGSDLQMFKLNNHKGCIGVHVGRPSLDFIIKPIIFKGRSLLKYFQLLIFLNIKTSLLYIDEKIQENHIGNG